MKIKVVADTNLFVAANHNPNSASSQVVNMIARRDLVLVWSEAIAVEMRKMMENSQAKDKFKNKIEHKVLRPESKVEPRTQVKEVKDDPDDNMFLEAAIEGNVDYIITSDQHLLRLGNFQNIPIFTPSNFWKVIKG